MVRTRLAIVVAALLAVAALAPRPAAASYVFYYHAFGDWAVTCWRNEPTHGRDCSLMAPPADLGGGGRRSQVSLRETAPGAYALRVQVRGIRADGGTVTLRVDDAAPWETAPDRAGLAAWSGPEVAKLAAAMRTGTKLTVRATDTHTGDSREEKISLVGFAQAMDVYRLKLRQEGVLRDN